MGSLLAPPLAPLVRQLQAKYALQTFVETGTYLGAGAAAAAQVFPRVFTIEVRADYFEAARRLLAPAGNVSCLLGDSRTELPKLVDGLEGQALFWLDGHMGGGNFGAGDDCPLLEELAAIAGSPFEHFILIDDARAFLAPPPPPFDADRWPRLPEIVETLRRRHAYDVIAIADCLICTPPAAREEIRAFCNGVRPKI